MSSNSVQISSLHSSSGPPVRAPASFCRQTRCPSSGHVCTYVLYLVFWLISGPRGWQEGDMGSIRGGGSQTGGGRAGGQNQLWTGSCSWRSLGPGARLRPDDLNKSSDYNNNSELTSAVRNEEDTHWHTHTDRRLCCCPLHVLSSQLLRPPEFLPLCGSHLWGMSFITSLRQSGKTNSRKKWVEQKSVQVWVLSLLVLSGNFMSLLSAFWICCYPEDWDGDKFHFFPSKMQVNVKQNPSNLWKYNKIYMYTHCIFINIYECHWNECLKLYCDGS